MFDMQSTGRGAAIIVEPVISAGGVLVPPRSFLVALRQAADERGMLLIFDEAQTAFGRIGKRTGSEHFDVVPDIMTMSKTLGGGLPLAAVSTTARIEEILYERHFAYYTSHVSDPLTAEVGLAVLNVIKTEKPGGACERDGQLSRQPPPGSAAASRGDRRRPWSRPARGRRAGEGPRVARARARTRSAHHEEMLREGPEHEHPPPAGAGVGVAHRAAVDGISNAEIDQAVDILEQALSESLDEMAGGGQA